MSAPATQSTQEWGQPCAHSRQFSSKADTSADVCFLPPLLSRFNSGLHQRDSRSALFEGYTGAGADNRRASPAGGYGYGYPGANGTASNGHLGVENRGFRPATPNRKLVVSFDKRQVGADCLFGGGEGLAAVAGYTTTRHKGKEGVNGSLTGSIYRGQYSDATLNELESQNDGQVEGILGKVKILKDVCRLAITVAGTILTALRAF